MAFDWREYLELARSLQGQGGSDSSREAAARSAVSRAYYAAYCYARNYASVRLRFAAAGTSDDHLRLRLHLLSLKMDGIAGDLQELRRWRNRCDYDDEVAGLPEIVTSAISTADRVIDGFS